MKKTLSMLAVLGIIAVGAQSAQAAWYDSNWNPSNWFGRGCNKCEKNVILVKKLKKIVLVQQVMQHLVIHVKRKFNNLALRNNLVIHAIDYKIWRNKSLI